MESRSLLQKILSMEDNEDGKFTKAEIFQTAFTSAIITLSFIVTIYCIILCKEVELKIPFWNTCKTFLASVKDRVFANKRELQEPAFEISEEDDANWDVNALAKHPSQSSFQDESVTSIKYACRNAHGALSNICFSLHCHLICR